MSKHYGSIAFTDDVRAVQCDHGSRAFYDRKRNAGQASSRPRPADGGRDRTTSRQRDSFYLATVGEAGWPYVQFRGGPTGFITESWTTTPSGGPTSAATCNTSRTGNLAGDNRVAIIAVDYAHRRRLKIFGACAASSTADEDRELADSLVDPEYRAVVERAVIVAVEAYDWNCAATHHPAVDRRRTRNRAGTGA